MPHIFNHSRVINTKDGCGCVVVGLPSLVLFSQKIHDNCQTQSLEHPLHQYELHYSQVWETTLGFVIIHSCVVSLEDLSPQRVVEEIESSTIVLHHHPPQRQGFAMYECEQKRKVVFIIVEVIHKYSHLVVCTINNPSKVHYWISIIYFKNHSGKFNGELC